MSQAAIHSGDQTVQLQLTPAPTGGALHRLLGLLIVAIRLAHHPELLVELKGPALSVLLALALRTDKQNSCFPSIDRIMQDTGYSRSSVCSALDRLEQAGLVRRMRRQRQSTRYILPAYGAEPPAPKTEAPSPVVQTVTASVSAAASSEARQRPSGEPEPERPAPVRGADSPPLEVPRQMRLSEWVSVRKKLLALGITSEVVEELIDYQARLGHLPRLVEAWLEAYRQGLDARRIKGPGWLVHALRHNWELPKEFREMAMSDEEKRLSYITGEFADYIEH